jgi:hypothetical protein
VLTIAIVAVQVTLLAAPEAPRPETSGSSSGRCAEFSKPAPPARIEGRVVSRDQKPRPNVQIRAMLPDTERVYTTASDGEGRFAIAGFDSDVTVDLEVGDSAMQVGCSLAIKRKTPVRTVTVVLDRRTARDAVADDVGCVGLPSWSSEGIIRILYGGDARAADAREKPARLELRSRDIARVVWEDDGATVLLNESARKALEAFTATNVSRPVMVAIDGMSTTKGSPYVQGTIDSGAVFVREDALRGPLCATLEAAPQAPR